MGELVVLFFNIKRAGKGHVVHAMPRRVAPAMIVPGKKSHHAAVRVNDLQHLHT